MRIVNLRWGWGWIMLIVCIRILAANTALAQTITEKYSEPQFGFDANEPMLYPAGCPTADTLRAKEILIAPLGWMSYGVTRDVTVMLDWLLAISGVPAVYVRYRLPVSAPNLGLAVEAYGFYLPVRVEDQLASYSNLIVEQRYWQAWLHLNSTWQLNPAWRVHAYAGFTYDPYQRYAPEGTSHFEEITYINTVTPDYGVGLEFAAASWMKIHFNYLSGNTLYFFDQIPQKRMATLAFQVTPFPRHWYGFFSRLRIEFTGFFIYVEPAQVIHTCPPFFPMAMWQWTW